MPDEGLHEIQLNGKQLVFLFMAATVVAVVVFLCGVMVGRGVPAPRGALVADISQTGTDPTAVAQTPTSTSIDSDNTPIAANEELTYTARLEERNPVPETLKPVAEPIAVAPAPVIVAPAVAVPKPVPEPKALPALREPAGRGFVVQVAAVRTRNDADAMAKRLS